ncbi:MAG TPA: glycosyltransferase family 2 protein [Polyangiaceae bacterium]
MRIVAIFAVYNEERFIERSVRHLYEQGVESYVIDNESSDATRRIVEGLRGRGVVGVETLPRGGVFELTRQLRRKERLHRELGADWYLHHDADEFRQAPNPHRTLAEGIEAVDRSGYNAIDFDEFVFMPTDEEPDFDHDRFFEEMQHYLYFAPMQPWRVNAWKNVGQTIDLVSMGGHQVRFRGRKLYPQRFILRHYLALSVQHAERKYCGRTYHQREIEHGWHGRRATLEPGRIYLPPRAQLKKLAPDNTWNTAEPWNEEPLFKLARPP